MAALDPYHRRFRQYSSASNYIVPTNYTLYTMSMPLLLLNMEVSLK
jgi:hypothetical protein